MRNSPVGSNGRGVGGEGGGGAPGAPAEIPCSLWRDRARAGEECEEVERASGWASGSQARSTHHKGMFRGGKECAFLLKPCKGSLPPCVLCPGAAGRRSSTNIVSSSHLPLRCSSSHQVGVRELEDVILIMPVRYQDSD